MTLVSHTYKFIYLKTRKTAGTSVEMGLQPFCTPPGTPVEEHGEAIISEFGIVGQRLGQARKDTTNAVAGVRDQWFAHHPAQSLKSKLPAEVWNSYRKIAVVRNPFAKVLSSFFWRKRDQDLPEKPERVRKQFQKMVLAERFAADREIVFVKDMWGNSKFVPDLIVRTEHLKEDLAGLAETLSLTGAEIELPRTKSTTARFRELPLSFWYDAETIEVVRRRLDWMFSAGDYPNLPS